MKFERHPNLPRMTLPDRARILYEFARTTGSYSLAGNAVELLRRDTTSERDTQEEVDAFFLAARTQTLRVFRSGRCGASPWLWPRRTDNIPSELVADITGSCTPEAVIDLAS